MVNSVYLEKLSLSTDTGVVPREWKKAQVVLIFKSGDISSLNNYRPISILPIVSKIIERAVHQQLSEFLDVNQLLHPNQSNFRPKHSTATALAKLVNQWSLNIDNKKISGVAFIDLRKAFDTVDHELLLHKLACIGCSNRTIYWFKSYLGGSTTSDPIQRSQVASINHQIRCATRFNCWSPFIFNIS